MGRSIARRRLRQNDPTSTRELILEEALRLAARHGIEQLKVKDIADAVGIQTPSIYKHFESRDAIITTLATRMQEEMAQFLRPDPSLDPERWIESWARATVLFFVDRPVYVCLILRDLSTPGGLEPLNATLGPPQEALQSDPLKQLSREFADVHTKGVKAGIFRQISYSALFALIWGAVLVSIVWPYGPERRKSLGATDIERLQTDAVAIAFQLIRKPRK